MTIEEIEAYAESDEHARGCLSEHEGVGGCCLWDLVDLLKDPANG